jgi:hypothetical protein
MEWIPTDWPTLARFSAAAFVGGFATVALLSVLYVLVRYLVLAPPEVLEMLYDRFRPRGRGHVGSHRPPRVQPYMRAETALIPALPLQGPPYGEEEYAELARRYRKTGGRTPSADERAADWLALPVTGLERWHERLSQT